ncbi:hypothetical protein NL532_24070 [Mesorhizobium sp. C120A]|uniref:hypothetical protein n=1 Tax=unclassified Mesorhizobium TaxID=325217 RepID=UPI0003D0608E|nr:MULTISPECIES: hypothetical protein [unclassified Mesorhizobium]ESZ60651.1 hypothetical protein X728_15025 [Mesorhizobium sp. L103C120A0]WJI43686.1 hypothetical protein NL532_24070 [Mesorhizobium sp. C120A]
MTTTTFKSVGGTSKPADQAAAKSAKGSAVPAPKAAKKPATAKPARKPGTITIEGKGTIPIHADGAMRRLPKGEPVKVSAAELAFIERSGIKFA